MVLVSAALYFGRIVFEPIAFMLFAMALVEPFQKAAEVRFGKAIALTLTIILTLLFLSILVWAIVWSISDIVAWGLANTERFQSLYMRTTQWLEEHDFVAGDLENLKPSSFVGMFQAVAGYVNYFLGFALMVLLFLIFGLAEMGDFRLKLAALDTKLSGWSLLETSRQIAEKIRKYMLIRTLASFATGVAVFLFTLAVGLDLAIAWGVISFVLNYIPYVGPLVAVILPVIFATAQFEVLADGGIHFRKFIPDPIRDRQLPGAIADRHRSCHLTLHHAGRVFNLGFSMGHARGFYRAPRDNRAFYDLGTESLDALDRRTSCQHLALLPTLNWQRPAESGGGAADVALRLFIEIAIDTGDKRTVV